MKIRRPKNSVYVDTFWFNSKVYDSLPWFSFHSYFSDLSVRLNAAFKRVPNVFTFLACRTSAMLSLTNARPLQLLTGTSVHFGFNYFALEAIEKNVKWEIDRGANRSTVPRWISNNRRLCLQRSMPQFRWVRSFTIYLLTVYKPVKTQTVESPTQKQTDRIWKLYIRFINKC